MAECIWTYLYMLRAQDTRVSVKPVSVACAVQNRFLVMCNLTVEESIVPFSPALEIVMKKGKLNAMWENDFFISQLKDFFLRFFFQKKFRTF